MRLGVAMVLVLVGCGGKSPPAHPTSGGQPYAALFTEGARWSFEVTPDGVGDPVIVTCEVSKFAEVDGVTSIEISCGDDWPDLGGDPLTGAWAMSAKGVSRENVVMIAFPPVTGTRTLPIPTDGVSDETLAQDGDAWCYSSRIGSVYDPSWDSMCVGPDGPTEGGWGYDGEDRAHEARFTRVR